MSSATVRRTAVIFDFDETLAVSTGAPRSNPSTLFGGRERISALRHLLADLSSAGITLCVCSHNARSTFEPLLAAADLRGFFATSMLFGCEVFEEGGVLYEAAHLDKGTVLSQLIAPALLARDASRSGGTTLPGRMEASESKAATPSAGTIDGSADGTSAMLFCDDDPANILDVRRACESCATLYVPRLGPASGLQTSHFAAIRIWGGCELGSAPPPSCRLPSADAEAERAASASPQPPALGKKRGRGRAALGGGDDDE